MNEYVELCKKYNVTLFLTSRIRTFTFHGLF